MKAWVIPTTLLCLGLGIGLGAPLVATQYMEPYLPSFLKKSLHPLEGIVTHKQRDQDRLLMTITTKDGTILATFVKHVAEIDLLVEEQDSITLDVKQYEPFVNDPPVLKVNKQVSQPSIPRPSLDSPPHTSMEERHLPDSQPESPPLSRDTPDNLESATPSTN
ncbi:MAG: hypothetical protein WD425_17685 [Nitrospirales bacterium]